MSPRSRRQYVYQREVHTHCKKTRFHARLLQPADDDLEGGRRRSVFPECGCFAPFWKNQRFSRSQEDVSLKTFHDHQSVRSRRRHSVTEDLLFRGRGGPSVIQAGNCYIEGNVNGQMASTSQRGFYSTPGGYVLPGALPGQQNDNRFVLLDGEESASTDNVTSNSSKFTIISVEVTKEFEHPTKTSKSTRPSDLRVDCSPPQKPKLDKSSPTLLSSPSFQLSDCSSPATLTEYWSPSCSPGLSPTYSPGLCPEILVTKPETSSCSLSDESLTEKLGESIV